MNDFHKQDAKTKIRASIRSITDDRAIADFLGVRVEDVRRERLEIARGAA